MYFLFASDFPPYDLLAALILGVPSLFLGTRMTLAGFYKRQQALHDERQESSTKLVIGAGLMILGIALVSIVVATITFGGY